MVFMHNVRAGFLTGIVQVKYGAIKLGHLFQSEWEKTPIVRLSYVFAITCIVMIIIVIIAIKMAGGEPKQSPPLPQKNAAMAADGLSKAAYRMAMEIGYFEGQKDAAVEGKFRIKQKDSTWVWARSPWDNDTDMAHIVYHPELGQKGSIEALLTRRGD